jgi:hypothetical protein
MMRSARVDLPWSTWAMMEKLRMNRIESEDMWGAAVSAVVGQRGIIARRTRSSPTPRSPAAGRKPAAREGAAGNGDGQSAEPTVRAM